MIKIDLSILNKQPVQWKIKINTLMPYASFDVGDQMDGLLQAQQFKSTYEVHNFYNSHVISNPLQKPQIKRAIAGDP